MSEPAAIRTAGLTKRYGAKVALDRLDLEVGRGVVFGFLGPNGAGKTTTIRCLLGMLRPNEGLAEVFGHDCWRDNAAAKRELATIAGDLRLDPWMSAENGLRFIATVRGGKTHDGRDLFDEGIKLAERFDLPRDVQVRNMSRGMRQKLGLILALAPHTPLLILDEPTTALDPLMQRELGAMLKERATEDGAAVFFSSHTLSEVDELCDRVAILRRGKLIIEEDIKALRRRAPRAVTLRWKSVDNDNHQPSAPSAPDWLHDLITSEEGARWDAHVTGPTTELVRWAAEQPALHDLEVRQADLEALFHRYYDGQDSVDADNDVSGSPAKETAS